LQRIQNKKYTYNANRAHAFTIQEMEDLDHKVLDYRKKSRSISVAKFNRNIARLAQNLNKLLHKKTGKKGFRVIE
jgi:hypothetical protein